MKRLSSLKSFAKKRKFELQIAALGLLILAPFGLYAALSAGLAALAAACFALLAAGMLLTFWAG